MKSCTRIPSKTLASAFIVLALLRTMHRTVIIFRLLLVLKAAQHNYDVHASLHLHFAIDLAHHSSLPLQKQGLQHGVPRLYWKLARAHLINQPPQPLIKPLSCPPTYTTSCSATHSSTQPFNDSHFYPPRHLNNTLHNTNLPTWLSTYRPQDQASSTPAKQSLYQAAICLAQEYALKPTSPAINPSIIIASKPSKQTQFKSYQRAYL